MKNILFYEMSNINGQSTTFNNLNHFYNVCNEWNIKVTTANRTFLETHDTVYVTCKPGKNELVMSGDYRNFRKNFSKVRIR